MTNKIRKLDREYPVKFFFITRVIDTLPGPIQEDMYKFAEETNNDIGLNVQSE